MAVVEGGNFISMSEADDITTTAFDIYTLAWVEDDASNKDIADDDDLTVEDGEGTVIFSKRASSAGDEVIINFPYPLTVKGIKAEDLDGGILYIYGKRR